MRWRPKELEKCIASSSTLRWVCEGIVVIYIMPQTDYWTVEHAYMPFDLAMNDRDCGGGRLRYLNKNIHPRKRKSLFGHDPYNYLHPIAISA